MTLSYSQPDVRVSQAPPVTRGGEASAQLNGGMCRQEQNHTSRPAGRRRSRGIGCRSLHITFAYFVLSAILILSARGVVADGTVRDGQYGRRARNGRLAQHGEEILLDRSPPPQIPSADLEKRQDLSLSSSKPSSATTSPMRRLSFEATATAIPSSSSGSSAAATTSLSTSDSTVTSLPKPFDGGFGTNYTQQSCPTFLKAFSTNQTFTSCLPFSLLLQNSVSFFDASRSDKRIVQTLDATCNINLPMCNDLMSSFAQDLKKDSNCGQDYRRQNPLVGQAYNGLIAYETAYKAGCQKDNTGSYCYAKAILNQISSTSDSFVYYLPLGIPLPAPAKPSCSQCQKDAMTTFHQASANTTQPVNKVYVDAARMIDMTCGPTFATTTIPDSTSAAPFSARPRTVPGVSICVAIGFLLIHSL